MFLLASIGVVGQFESSASFGGFSYSFNMHIYQYQTSITVTEAGNTDNFAYGALLTYQREGRVIFSLMKAVYSSIKERLNAVNQTDILHRLWLHR